MASIQQLLQYNAWANYEIAKLAGQLSRDQFHSLLGGSFPSIQKTMVHLLESDWLWAHRLKGFSIVEIPADWHTETAGELIAIWQPLQEEMIISADQFNQEPDQLISFITRKGDPYTMPALDMIQHIVNHGTYHRGQLTNMLKMLGMPGVSTDYIIWWKMNGGK